MKRIVLFLFLCIAFLAFQNCKCDPQVEPPAGIDCDFVDTMYEFPGRAPGQLLYYFPPIPDQSDNPPTGAGVLLGRMLFYDSILAINQNMACASCHLQEYAFGDPLPKSINAIGVATKRHSPVLFNMLWHSSFFWDGRSTTVTAQVADALQGELHMIPTDAIGRLQTDSAYVAQFKHAFGCPGDITEDRIQKAIAQFMMTLISADSKFDKYRRGEAFVTAEEQHGFDLFTSDTIVGGADCVHCHMNSVWLTFVEPGFRNNALDTATGYFDFADLGRGEITGNPLDNGKFKTPTVRNAEVSGPYMHDGRFGTLEQVINFYNDSLKGSPTRDANMKATYRGGLRYLTQQDKEDLIAFIKMLTDTSFLHNPAHGNPFH